MSDTVHSCTVCGSPTFKDNKLCTKCDEECRKPKAVPTPQQPESDR